MFAFSLPTIAFLGASCYIQKVIKSAVVPVAGLGTRLLPATKSQPKEMLPVARKPIVQYVVEELVSNGIEQILFVTGRSKASIENHFDHDPELFRALTQGNKHDLLREVEFEALKANFFYTRQRFQRGLGDAILCGENFAGEKPFLVALGDSILGLNAVSRAVGRMADVFDSKRASCVIAVEEVPVRRDLALRHRSARGGLGRRFPHRQPGGEALARRSAEQSGHCRPLHFLAGDLRHDPPREARQAQ